MSRRGIVVACPQKYEQIWLQTMETLRNEHGCNLPIEIWEIGQEISSPVKEKMAKLSDVTFKNVQDYSANPNHWKGFQVKVFALYHCAFDEPILCDADVSFYKSPDIIYEDPNYIRTGAYFFKDLDSWTFRDLSLRGTSKFTSLVFYGKRKQFIQSLIPKKHNLFPKEWLYLYESNPPTAPVKEALQESGVVYMDKKRHAESLRHIFAMNENHPQTYQYVWGDKETFWLGCVMANQPFYFNEPSGFMHNECLTHSYKNELFWKQK